MSDELNIDDIKNMYEKQKMSWAQIAEHYDTYVNKIIRFVKRNGSVEARSMSEAQSLSLKKGRRKHPTKGQKRPESVKNAIGEKQSHHWKNASVTERKHRSDVAKELWSNKSAEEVANMRENAIQAVLKASKEGSKFENYVCENLIKDGYSVETHKEDLIPVEKVHIDAFLPELGIAIEIDGPAHFLPIWGQDKLDKHIAKDTHKNSILLGYKFTVLRVKCLTKNISKTKMSDAYKKVVEEIENIKNNPGIKNAQLIEIEVQ
jgi:very-short-patch-repair endonuclease